MLKTQRLRFLDVYEISKCTSGANHLSLVMIVYSVLTCGDHGLVSLCDWPSPGLAEQRVRVGNKRQENCFLKDQTRMRMVNMVEKNQQQRLLYCVCNSKHQVTKIP